MNLPCAFLHTNQVEKTERGKKTHQEMGSKGPAAAKQAAASQPTQVCLHKPGGLRRSVA